MIKDPKRGCGLFFGKVRSTHRVGSLEHVLMMSICQTGDGDGLENKKSVYSMGRT